MNKQPFNVGDKVEVTIRGREKYGVVTRVDYYGCYTDGRVYAHWYHTISDAEKAFKLRGSVGHTWVEIQKVRRWKGLKKTLREILECQTTN